MTTKSIQQSLLRGLKITAEINEVASRLATEMAPFIREEQSIAIDAFVSRTPVYVAGHTHRCIGVAKACWKRFPRRNGTAIVAKSTDLSSSRATALAVASCAGQTLAMNPLMYLAVRIQRFREAPSAHRAEQGLVCQRPRATVSNTIQTSRMNNTIRMQTLCEQSLGRYPTLFAALCPLSSQIPP